MLSALSNSRMVEMLEKSESRFRRIYESDMIGIAFCRETGEIEDANDAFLNMVGYTRQDLVAGNVNWAKMTPPEQMHLTREGIEEAKAKSIITPFEKEYIRKDGSRVPVLMGGATLSGDKGVGIAYAIDMTEPKRAEEALREREQTIRALVETSKDWIWAIDLEGVHTYSNTGIESILGYSVDELIGTQSLDLMHPEDKEKVEKMLPEWVSRKEGWRNQLIRWRHKDGSYRHLESNAEPILDAKGLLTGFRGVDRDVTERKEAERILKENQERIRLLFETVPHAVYECDLDGVITVGNSAYSRITGYSSDGLVGMHVWDFMEEGQLKDSLPEYLRQLAAEQPAPSPYECRNTTKDGGTIDVEVNWDYKRDEGGQVTGFVCILSDVTARNRAEENLRSSEERYRALFEQAGDSILLIDLTDGSLIEFNDKAHENLGYTRQEFEKLKISDLDIGESQADVERHAEKVAEEGTDTFETVMRTKDGRMRDILVSAKSVRIGDRQCILSVLRDITELKQAAAEIGNLAKFPSENPNPVLRISNEGVILYANEVSTDVLETWRCRVGEKMPAECYKRIESAVGSMDVSEFEFKCSNGRIFSATLSPVVDAGYVNVYGLDITERNKDRDEVRESRERLSNVLGSISDGFFAIDKGMMVTYFNKAAEDLLNMRRENVLGCHLFDEVFPDAKGTIFEEKYTWAMRENQPVSFEAFFDYDPIRNWYSVRAYPFKDGLSVYFQVVTERKEAEETLRKHQYHLEKAQEIGSIGSWDLDIKENELIWTRENYRIFGIPLESELSYESFLNCVHPDDREYVDKKWNAALNREPYDIEHRLIVDGKIKWVREKAELLFDDKGNCVGGTGFTQDITDRKGAEEALRESEELHRITIESISDAVFMTDDNGDFTFICPNVNVIFGYSYAEVESLGSISKLLGDGLFDIEALKTAGEMVNIERDIRDKQGDNHSLLINVKQVSIKNGTVLYTCRDISDRKEAEEALRDSEERFRRAVTEAPFPIMIHADDGEVLQINKVWTELTGYEPEEIPTLSAWTQRAYGERKDVVKSRIDKIFSYDTRVEEGEYIISSKDGRTLTWDFSSAPLRTLPDGRRMVISIAMDVTERKEIKEKIEKLAKFPSENPNPVVRIMRDGTMVFGNRSSVPLQNAWGCQEGEKLEGQWLATVVEALNFGTVQRGEIEYEDHTFSLTFAPVVESGYVNVYAHDITDLRQAEDALQWESSVNKALAHLSNVLNKPYYSFEEISDLVLAHAQRLTGSKFGYCGYIDEQTGYLVSPTLTKQVWKQCQIQGKDIVFKKFTGLWGWVLNERESVLVNSPGDDPRATGTPEGHIPIDRFVGAPSLVGDEVVGMVAIANPDGDYTERDLWLVERLAEVYALAIQANRSQRMLTANQKQLRSLAASLGLADERRRRRVAKGMHEELIGPLCFVENRVASLIESDTDKDGPMPQVREAISDLLETTRSYVSELSYPVLGELGFEKAVERWLSEEVAARHGIETVFENGECCDGLDDDVKFFLFEAIRELLANTVEHAQATKVRVSLTSDDDRMEVAVEDDGIGFDATEAIMNAHQGTSYSLLGIRERLRHLGGDMVVDSRIGEGTKVVMSVPLESAKLK